MIVKIVVPTFGSLLATLGAAVNLCPLRGARAGADAIFCSLVFLAPIYAAAGAGFVDDNAGKVR
jgi:hypothetical protein